MATKQFKAESKRLLDLMINSIYTHKEIFLRELISNASDAIDKLYYLSLTENRQDVDRDAFEIHLDVDREARTLTIRDNGLGMNKEELEENLGTIKISDEVITVCAANIVSKIPGVCQLTGGFTESLSKNILGIDPSGKGIKLSRSDEDLILDIYVIVEYGVRIPQLAWEIQSKVKQ